MAANKSPSSMAVPVISGYIALGCPSVPKIIIPPVVRPSPYVIDNYKKNTRLRIRFQTNRDQYIYDFHLFFFTVLERQEDWALTRPFYLSEQEVSHPQTVTQFSDSEIDKQNLPPDSLRSFSFSFGFPFHAYLSKFSMDWMTRETK